MAAISTKAPDHYQFAICGMIPYRAAQRWSSAELGQTAVLNDRSDVDDGIVSPVLCVSEL